MLLSRHLEDSAMVPTWPSADGNVCSSA